MKKFIGIATVMTSSLALLSSCSKAGSSNTNGSTGFLSIKRLDSKEKLKDFLEFNGQVGQIQGIAKTKLTLEQAQKIETLLTAMQEESVKKAEGSEDLEAYLAQKKQELPGQLILALKESDVSASVAIEFLSLIKQANPGFVSDELTQDAFSATLKDSYTEFSELSSTDIVSTFETEPEKAVEKFVEKGAIEAPESDDEEATETESSNDSEEQTETTAECTSSSEVGCKTTELIPALTKSEINPTSLVKGTTLLGVEGTAIEQPKDLGNAPWNGVTPPTYNAEEATNAGCPENFALIPGSKRTGIGYVGHDYCVSRFPTRVKQDSDDSLITTFATGLDVNTHSPSFDPAGYPWVAISTHDAESECQSLGDGYHMTTNREWQSIALLIEQVGVNWESGTVGTGSLYVGLEVDYMGSPDYSDIEISDISNPYSNTGNSEADAFGSGKEERRTSYLPNGEVLWDFVRGSEWVQPSAKDGRVVEIAHPDEDGGAQGNEHFYFEFDSSETYSILHSLGTADDVTFSPPNYLALAPWMFMPSFMSANSGTQKYDGGTNLNDSGFGRIHLKNESSTTKGLFRGDTGLFGISAYEARSISGWGGNSFRCTYFPN